MNKSLEKPYLNPYIAGILLGCVLLTSFFITGKGFGASGAFNKIVAQAMHVVAPAHVESNPYLAKYVAETDHPDHATWLMIELIGVLVGGFLSGLWSGRLRLDVEKGPRISSGGRLTLALLGGVFIGFASRMARGCTSGQGLAGGSLLSAGSWIFLMSIFAGGYATAYIVRKQWI